MRGYGDQSHGLCVSVSVRACVCECPRCKRKTTCATNTKLGRRIQCAAAFIRQSQKVKDQGHAVIGGAAGVGMQVGVTAWLSVYA